MKITKSRKRKGAAAVACSDLLGGTSSEVGAWQRLFVGGWINDAVTAYRLRCLELRMIFCQARIRCLQCGYFAGDEADLRARRILWRAAVNHPIKIVQIFEESFHKMKRDTWPNVKAVYPPCPDAEALPRFVWGRRAWRIHCG